MKKIYETRAKQDKEQLITICEQILKGLKLTNENDYFKVVANSNYNLIDIICKNWTQLKLFEYSKFETTLPDISEYGMCENHEKVNLIWYFLVKASEQFYINNKVYPEYSYIPHDYSLIKNKFIDEIRLYLKDINSEIMDLDQLLDEIQSGNYVHEFLRNSRLKIAPAISIIGSLASQEIIKQLTYCFMSINNTLIFNGIGVTTSVFEMKN